MQDRAGRLPGIWSGVGWASLSYEIDAEEVTERRTNILRGDVRIRLMTKGRLNRFLKNLGSALGHCLIEDTEVLVPVIVVLSCLCVVYLLGVFVYDFVLDSNSVDVASRLSSLSIDPDKWKFLS